MIAVTGSTGRLGIKVATRLANLGVGQRLIVRDPGRAPQLPGAEVVQASSYGDAKTMGRALTNVKILFLVAAHDIMGVTQQALKEQRPVPTYNRLQQHKTTADVAAAVGVEHIVYLSFLNAAKDSTFVLAHDHYYTEEHIRQLGVDFTFLRMSLYADHVPVNISRDGVFRVAAGEGRAAWVTRDDIADVAVAVLTGSGHAGRTYDVTGPEAITMKETAEILSSVTGRTITYEALTPPEVRATRKGSGLEGFEAARRKISGQGLSDYEVEIWVTHFEQIATGELSTVSDTVPRLTGHKAQSLAEFLEKNPESYRHLVT